MPNWKDINDELKAMGSTHDILRRKYIKELHEVTGRNIIVYYSGWLQKADFQRQGVIGFELNDEDKNGFMSAIHRLDRSKGLDLLLHTPGGEMAATESLVNYLKGMFDGDIRAIVPQIALSAGTMIACACKEIVMGKQSSLGPIDPQVNGIPAHGVIEEFERARKEIHLKPSAVPLWQPIIAKYNPSFIGECEKAIKWSNEMVEEWLLTGMFKNEEGSEAVKVKVANIIKELGDHALTLSHNRHISINKAIEIGLNVSFIEEDDSLQNAVLTVHHTCMHTLNSTGAIKIIENQDGVAFIKVIRIGKN